MKKRKNSLFTIALLSIGLFWASCKGTDPEPSAVMQTQKDVLSNGGVWKVDSARYDLTANVAGALTPVETQRYVGMDTLEFQPINEDSLVAQGHGGLRRGLLIRQHTADSVTVRDTLNWQVAQASLVDETPRLIIFYNPGPDEVQYSFTFSEKSASRIVMQSNKDLVVNKPGDNTVNGQNGHGFRKYALSR